MFQCALENKEPLYSYLLGAILSINILSTPSFCIDIYIWNDVWNDLFFFFILWTFTDEYIHLKRIEHPERAQKAKMSLSKFDRYRDAEEEESEEDEDEGLVCAAANIKLENEGYFISRNYFANCP